MKNVTLSNPVTPAMLVTFCDQCTRFVHQGYYREVLKLRSELADQPWYDDFVASALTSSEAPEPSHGRH